jgi:prolyl-tRNA editing enzyme YbaK/EbsC (Cys-tRNA(Pro) deacylase)
MSSGPDRLEAFLRQHGVDAEILYPGKSTATVAEAAAALGVHPGQIIKSLLFQGKDGATVLVIARGESRVDQRKLTEATGLRQPRLAPPQVVLELTGYPPGATPPVGHLTPLKVIVDRSVLQEPIVYGGGGGSDVMLRISPHEILRLTGAIVADVTSDAARDPGKPVQS